MAGTGHLPLTSGIRPPVSEAYAEEHHFPAFASANLRVFSIDMHQHHAGADACQ